MEINVAYGIFRQALRDSDVLPTYEWDLFLFFYCISLFYELIYWNSNSMGKKKSIIYNELLIDQNCRPYKCQSGLPLSQFYAVNVKKLLDYIGKVWQLISSLYQYVLQLHSTLHSTTAWQHRGSVLDYV